MKALADMARALMGCELQWGRSVGDCFGAKVGEYTVSVGRDGHDFWMSVGSFWCTTKDMPSSLFAVADLFRHAEACCLAAEERAREEELKRIWKAIESLKVKRAK